MVVAMQPRLLITLVEDEAEGGKLKQVNVSVRVGQAVDVVAQAGKPKTITGFQTHTTPVLLAYGERAELANDECKSTFSCPTVWFRHRPHALLGGPGDPEEESGLRGEQASQG